jgi:ABC-2 type transport system permease protein
MLSIFLKEINSFFSSLIAYIVIGVFLAILGLIMWVFPDTSLLNYNYATLDQLFDMAPIIFMFLIPAITMRSFAEESQAGTIEILSTKPLSDFAIVGGKFLANFALVIFAILPTLIYYYSVYKLGAPEGNLDSGAIMGSYIGLILLGGVFTSIGVFSSALTNNQIVAFILAVFFCFLFHWGFFFFSKLPVFVGKFDDVVQMIGIDYHYLSISKGVVDSRDVIYFFSVILAFLGLTVTVLEKRKW